MPPTAQRAFAPGRVLLLLGALLFAVVGRSFAQVPVQVQPGERLPNAQEAEELLRNQPGLVDQLRDRLAQSGLSPDQVRSRLRSAGYPESMLDQYMPGADTTLALRPDPRTLDAVRALGILSPEEADSLRVSDSLFVVSDSLRQVLDSLKLVRLDSLRADSLADSVQALRPSGLKLFGLETFRKFSTQFEPAETGPVDENYRLGPGDVLVLILTGDVERVMTLNVTREGFVVIPQVGQVYVANLTLSQLEDQLYTRLGRVYSGVRRSPDARTRFQLSIARLKNIQVYVAGDVVRPGGYSISAAGTVLTALYAAGGPTENGSFRRVEIRRGRQLVDSLDLYEYLLRGANPTDVRLQSGDVVFVPVHGGFAKVAGKVTRPAMYELLPQETLRDLIAYAGGFDPLAYQGRVTIHRVLPPDSRGPGGRARVVVAVGSDQFVGGAAPPVPMASGDSVTVHAVADRLRGYITVLGNVWAEGQQGFTPGMKLSDAIRLAGGPRPDVYLDRILVTRVREDSSMIQLRSAFADSTGRVLDDMVLEDEDEIRVFSRSSFRAAPTVAIVGAVRRPGRVPYREGMTLRDAVLLAGGPTEDAWLGEAEIARRERGEDPGTLATTVRVSLDSTYRFDQREGAPRPVGGQPEPALQPYDNVLIMRQPGWELQRSVALTGQVKYPGRYTLRNKTERLSEVIARAGGLTGEAYADGIEFYRSYFDGKPSRGDRLEPPKDSVRTRPMSRDTVSRLIPERLGIELPRVLKNARHRDNIILVGGDSIHIPEYDPVIMVQGAVNSPGPVAYTPGKNLDWYVNAAGGYTQTSDKGHAYVTQPNGDRDGVKRRVLLADHMPKPRPGAQIYVPTKIIEEQPSNLPSILGTVAQIVGVLTTVIIVASQN